MPHLHATIGGDGPVVDLTIWAGAEQFAALLARGQAPPGPRTVRALIDTGADRSAIDHILAGQLGLVATDVVPVRSSAAGAAPVDAPVFDARMTFGSLHGAARPQWQEVRPIGVSVVARGGGVLALIGRDLLETCLLVYDGPRREIVVAY